MIDWARVAELRDEIGAEDFDEVVDLFLSEVSETIDQLPDAAKDTAELAARLHFLKGSALNLGFETLATLCQDGERAASTGAAATVDLAVIIESYGQSRTEFLRELPMRLAA